MMLHTMNKRNGDITIGELKECLEMLDVPDSYTIIHQDLLGLYSHINQAKRDDEGKRLILKEDYRW